MEEEHLKPLVGKVGDEEEPIPNQHKPSRLVEPSWGCAVPTEHHDLIVIMRQRWMLGVWVIVVGGVPGTGGEVSWEGVTRRRATH